MTALGPPPSESAAVGVIGAWCNEADQWLLSQGIGFPPDTVVRLLIQALASAMGCPPDELDAHLQIARLRLLKTTVEQAPAMAARARLLGPQMPPNGQGR